jgi:beta-N-acetylhexosaminidase
MLRAGMAHCVKHFPGHGAVAADSHVAVPVDRRTLKTLLADDAQPYGWLSSSLMAVMPAHVVYTRVDRRPAGFSSRWLQDILRGRLGFTGAIFSDDLGMEAACIVEGRRVARSDSALLALQAGCDMVLLCNQSQVDGGRELDTFLEALDAAQAQGRWAPDPCSDARRLALLPQTPPVDWDALMHDPVYRRALDLLP